MAFINVLSFIQKQKFSFPVIKKNDISAKVNGVAQESTYTLNIFPKFCR